MPKILMAHPPFRGKRNSILHSFSSLGLRRPSKIYVPKHCGSPSMAPFKIGVHQDFRPGLHGQNMRQAVIGPGGCGG